jgi:hypothetical protein
MKIIGQITLEELVQDCEEICGNCWAKGFTIEYKIDRRKKNPHVEKKKWCEECNGKGKILTDNGKALLAFLNKYWTCCNG